MYCKKCGRKLEDGMRYCDRCGQSVRQNRNTGKEARRKEIEELKKERLNRRQKLQEKEKKKQKNRQINKKRINVLAVIFIVLFCILIIAVIVYNATLSESENAVWRTRDGAVELNTTTVPSQSPAPTNNANMPTATAYALTGEVNADGYREFKHSESIVLPYPATFEQQRAENGEKLNLYDKSGGASIVLKDEGPVSAQAKALMSEYAKSQSGKVSYSRAGDGWYVVETIENDIVHHRKCLIVNNRTVYYDFTYSTTSSAASTYKRQIEYIDEHFSL